eukprot:10539603-Ditylum_brightwellii.AAC.1
MRLRYRADLKMDIQWHGKPLNVSGRHGMGRGFIHSADEGIKVGGVPGELLFAKMVASIYPNLCEVSLYGRDKTSGSSIFYTC